MLEEFFDFFRVFDTVKVTYVKFFKDLKISGTYAIPIAALMKVQNIDFI